MVEIFTDLAVWMGIKKIIDQISANAVAQMISSPPKKRKKCTFLPKCDRLNIAVSGLLRSMTTEKILIKSILFKGEI